MKRTFEFPARIRTFELALCDKTAALGVDERKLKSYGSPECPTNRSYVSVLRQRSLNYTDNPKQILLTSMRRKTIICFGSAPGICIDFLHVNTLLVIFTLRIHQLPMDTNEQYKLESICVFFYYIVCYNLRFMNSKMCIISAWDISLKMLENHLINEQLKCGPVISLLLALYK